MTSYKTALNKLHQHLDQDSEIILSTSQKDCVTARVVSTFRIHNKLYFQTDINSVKAQQLMVNPNVSLADHHYSITGKAKILGKTKDPLLVELMTEYAKKHPNAHKLYSGMDENRLIEVSLTLAKAWDYIDEKPYECYLDISNETYQADAYNYHQSAE